MRLKTVFIVTGRFDEETSDDERLVSGQEKEREIDERSILTYNPRNCNEV